MLGVGHQNRKPADYIKRAHDRHHGTGDCADAANAAENDRAHQYRQHQSGDPGRNTEVEPAQFSHVPGLKHIATGYPEHDQRNREQQPHDDAESCQFRRQCGETLFAHPHGSAVGLIGIAHVAVQQGQRDLGALDRHADQTHHPHPEYRARPPQADRDGHASDIAETDRGRQRGRQGLEMRKDAVTLTGDSGHLAANQGDSVRQRTILAEAAPDREQHAHAEQAKQHRHGEHDAIDCAQYLEKSLHRLSLEGGNQNPRNRDRCHESQYE